MKNKFAFILFIMISSLYVMGRAFVAVPEVTNPPAIDGKIDPRNEWREAVSLTNFVDIDKEHFAFQQTRAWLCHDRKYLYLGFKLYDSHLLHASNMRASFKNTLKGHRQKVWEDDCMEIRILPPWIKKTAGFSHFYLGFNANAATMSLAPSGYNNEWELECKVKTAIEEGFWQAELKIPLSVFGKDKTGKVDLNNWKFNFIRFEQAANSRSSWEIIPDKKHNGTKYMAGMQLASEDIPALKIPDMTNGNPEKIILPYFSKIRFLARLWSYPWPARLGQNSRDRYRKGDSSLLVFQKGLNKESFKPAIPAKGMFFFEFGITYGRKAQRLYTSPDYIFDSDRQDLVLNGKNIKDIKFNGNGLMPEGKEIKLNPAPGLNILTFKSESKNVSLGSSGEIPLPAGIGAKTENNVQTIRFYNKITNLQVPGGSQKLFSMTAGNAYPLIWEAADTKGIQISGNAQSMALNLLLPAPMKVIGVSSSEEYPNGFPEVRIKPYKNIYRLTTNGSVDFGNRKFIHYVISTDELQKYTGESSRASARRTRCIIVLKTEKILNGKDLKFYYYASVGKNKIPELTNSCKLLILPQLNGKQPEKCRFTMYYTWFNGIRDKEMMNAVYSTAKAAGANEVFLTNTVDPENYGLKKTDFFQMETYAWRKSTLEMKNIFKKFPGSRSRNGGYSKYASLSYLSRHPETWELLDDEMKNIRKRDPHLTGLFWDYEFSAFAHYADFSPYTLEIFAKNYGINEKLDKKIIERKYLDKWIDFRCEELGRISAILKKIAGKYGFEFNFYAAGAMKIAKNRYSIDITKLSADRLYLGGTWFSGDTKKIKDFSRKSRTPLSFSVHMCKIDKTGWQEAVILRRVIMTGGNGVLLWYELGFDGAQLTAIANVTRLMAEYEKLFRSGKVEAFGPVKNKIVYSGDNLTPQPIRQSLLGDIKSEKAGLVVYEAGGKFLALLINDTPKDITLNLTFQKSKGEITEFYSNKIYHSGKEYSISLGAFKVAAFSGKLQ